ncbi:MAG: hypothetical protein ACYDIE_07855 [Candidatus Krumholzibacteriia bacterium]
MRVPRVAWAGMFLLGAGAGCGRRAAPALTVEALRNASYHVEYVEQGRVTLRDGRYVNDGETPVRITLLDSVAFGDLDGDGAVDAAALLACETGGSGVFIQLAPVFDRGGRPRNPATTFLGDRVKVAGIAIRQGRIVIDLVVHGPGDPQCCPTRRETRVYRWTGKRLVDETASATVAPASR